LAGSHSDPRVRIAKNALENVVGLGAKDLAKSQVVQRVASLFGGSMGPQLARGIISTVSVFGAAGLQVPRLSSIPLVGPVLLQFFRSVGINDPQAVQDILNEVFDESVQEFGRTFNEGTNVSDAQIKSIVDRKTREVTGKLKGLTDNLGKDVKSEKILLKEVAKIDKEGKAYTAHEAHFLICPKCQPVRRIQKGKKGKGDKEIDVQKERVVYPEGVVESTIGFAIENEFEPTEDPCCKNSIRKLFDQARKVPMDLFEIIRTFPDERQALRERFFTIVATATESQRDRLTEVATQKVWEGLQDLVATFLEQSVVRPAKGQPAPANPVPDPEKFITLLEARVPQAPKTVQQTVMDMLTGKGEDRVARIRERSHEIATKLRASGDRSAAQLRFIRQRMGR
jgi:hypothetical protein